MDEEMHRSSESAGATVIGMGARSRRPPAAWARRALRPHFVPMLDLATRAEPAGRAAGRPKPAGIPGTGLRRHRAPRSGARRAIRCSWPSCIGPGSKP